jgi:hypothetical protein
MIKDAQKCLNSAAIVRAGHTGSDVRWKLFRTKFSAIFFQKIFSFLKSSLNISFFNLFLVALGSNEIAITVDIAEYRNKEKLWSRDVIWRAAVSVSDLSVSRSRKL